MKFKFYVTKSMERKSIYQHIIRDLLETTIFQCKNELQIL